MKYDNVIRKQIEKQIRGRRDNVGIIQTEKFFAGSGGGERRSFFIPYLAHTRPAIRGKSKLGFDNFSIRNLEGKASQILQYAAGLKVDVVFFSDLDVYESLEEDYLKKLKKPGR